MRELRRVATGAVSPASGGQLPAPAHAHAHTRNRFLAIFLAPGITGIVSAIGRTRRGELALSPDKRLQSGYILAVSASEIIKELPKLSEEERRAILDKLRELAQVDDERWEEIINDPVPRPKLQTFIEQATAEGSEPLDLNRM